VCPSPPADVNLRVLGQVKPELFTVIHERHETQPPHAVRGDARRNHRHHQYRLFYRKNCNNSQRENRMAFILHYNVVGAFWQSGQPDVPPSDPPDTMSNMQTMKPYVSITEWQFEYYRANIFRVIVPVELYPHNPDMNDNGVGSTIMLSAIPDFYLEVVGIWPIWSEGDLIAWQCTCRWRVPN